MEHNLRKIVGYNIKYYRFIKNLTQEALAEKCNLSPRYISDLENSRGNVSIDTIEEIAYALNIEVFLLFKSNDNKVLPKRVNMYIKNNKN